MKDFFFSGYLLLPIQKGDKKKMTDLLPLKCTNSPLWRIDVLLICYRISSVIIQSFFLPIPKICSILKDESRYEG